MLITPENIIEFRNRQNKKRGLLMPKNKKEKKVKFRVEDKWLTVEECIARGLKVTVKKGDEFVEVSSNREVLESLNIKESYKVPIQNENQEIDNVSNVITKEDLEERIQRLREKLEFMYSDNELMDTTATIHKEGQMYAYKSLLRQLSEK